MRAFPTVNYRHLFLQKVMAANELDFSNEATWPLQEEGRADAMAALSQEQGFGFKLLNEWVESGFSIDGYKTFGDYYNSAITI